MSIARDALRGLSRPFHLTPDLLPGSPAGAPQIAIPLGREAFAFPAPEYPGVMQDYLDNAIRAHARVREARDRQAAFLLFGVHL